MDCEKFEPLLLDELYEELDELTSAAVKRHVSGCARCAAALHGMRATRRLATLPVVPVPAGLEERIFAAAREAQKVVPIQSRMSRAVSWAGRWAMRPQTAMAAVFLLMIGSSAFVLRARKDSSPRAAAVSEWGAPATTVVSPSGESLDNPAAAAAHGAVASSPTTLPPAAAAPATSAFALADDEAPGAGGAGPMDRLTGGAARDKGKDAKGDQALAALVQAQAAQKEGLAERESAQAEKQAEKKKAFARSGPAPTTAADPLNAAAPGGAADGDFAQQAPPPAQNVVPKAGASEDGYSAGMAAYRARKYADATAQFDNAAAGGDTNAALWAAKAVKAGNGGCSVAVPRFDAVAQRVPGTPVGNEALFEAADCQIEMPGQADTARARLTALLNTQSHKTQAQQALNRLNQVVARRAAETRGGGSGGSAVGAPRSMARPAAPAPVRAPAEKRSDSNAAGY